MELIQKKRNRRKHYRILENGMWYEVQNGDNFQSTLIKFEDIGFDEIVLSERPDKILLSLYFSILVNFFFLLFFIEKESPYFFIISTGFLIFAIIFPRQFLKMGKMKYLKGKTNIDFFYSKTEQLETDNFIATLKKCRINYFKNKYLYQESIYGFEFQKGILIWLYEQEIITKQEFSELNAENESNKLISGNL